jgi:hypothetical protein
VGDDSEVEQVHGAPSLGVPQIPLLGRILMLAA